MPFVLAAHPEATISVRGKERFVVMDLAQYHYLRECELDSALAQTRADMEAGRYVIESAGAHVARLAPAAKTVKKVARKPAGRAAA